MENKLFYEIDWDRVNTLEDMKIIIKALDIRVDDMVVYYNPEIAKFLKGFDD